MNYFSVSQPRYQGGTGPPHEGRGSTNHIPPDADVAMGPAAAGMAFRLGTPRAGRGAASTDVGAGLCKLSSADTPITPRHRGSWVWLVLDRTVAKRWRGGVLEASVQEPPSPPVTGGSPRAYTPCRHVIQSHIHTTITNPLHHTNPSTPTHPIAPVPFSFSPKQGVSSVSRGQRQTPEDLPGKDRGTSTLFITPIT